MKHYEIWSHAAMCCIRASTVHITTSEAVWSESTDRKCSKTCNFPELNLFQNWIEDTGGESLCVLPVLAWPQLPEKGSPMQVREEETTKHPPAINLQSPDPVGLWVFFFPLWLSTHKPSLAPLKSPKLFQRKRKMHADPGPLSITFLCYGIVHR